MPFACDLAIVSHAPISDAECLPWLDVLGYSIAGGGFMHNMVLVNLVTKKRKTIPIGMAETFEDAEELIDYADRLIGMK